MLKLARVRLATQQWSAPRGRGLGAALANRSFVSSSSPPSGDKPVSDSISTKGLDLEELLGRKLKATARELSVEMLPALKVLSESLGLLKEAPAFQNWNATDWLMGLTVLAQHNTVQRKRNRSKASVLSDDAHQKPMVVDPELLERLLRYVRVCDAVYASSVANFCKEAGVSRESVARAHPGGVVSPKCVILVDHEHRELVLVVRGSASLLDFCTDLCLMNEPFQGGQGHRGMVHAATWLVRHLRDDLTELAKRHPDYALVATGHSLGAAVAALSAMQLRGQFPGLHCYCFGTPACVTRELAAESYDFVTTVVNGFDCVPRLHQHSLLKLRDEIKRFDWRATLRELVAEEIREQKRHVQKQQRARLGQLQQALRKLDGLQLKQRTHEATAKLDEVKKLASQNIQGFANDVDDLIADKLDAAFSLFKTDKLSLEHVGFIRNLLTLEGDDKQRGDSFWWKRMDESVLTLERLSTAVKKPEELERVLQELKHVLKLTSSSSPPLESGGSSNSDSDADSNQLELFRSRIDSIIDKIRVSLKSRLSEQVSKVSSAVTSNVSEYVDTVKDEAEALSDFVQEELDDVSSTIAKNLPLAVGLTREEAQKPRRTGKERGVGRRENAGFTDVSAGERIELPQRAEDLEEHRKLQDEQQKWEEDNRVRHDPLFPPGRVLYLNRVTVPAPQEEENDDDDDESHATKEVVEFVEVETDEFSRVVLSNRMLLDHLCTDYERVLQSQAKRLQEKYPPSQQ